nr:acyl-CoA dehydrogenase family protein [Angustibacter aerolatus]
MTAVEREPPTDEAHDLLDLVRQAADERLRPLVDDHEQKAVFPREVFAEPGCCRAPRPALPRAARRWWAAVHRVPAGARGASPRPGAPSASASACTPWPATPSPSSAPTPSASAGCPACSAATRLGAYCLSETGSGSDAAALRTRAVRDGDEYVVTGSKAWITHGGVADFYELMVRTGDDGPRGISCLLADAGAPGLSVAAPERKMGFRSSQTAQVLLDGVRLDADRLIGAEGTGFNIALSALDSGRLGIAACAVGIAQAALDAAVEYARERRQFGQRIIDHQGLQFMLADMATQVAAARE